MTLHAPEPRVLDIAAMTDDDRGRLIAALLSDGTFVLPPDPPAPLLTGHQIARMRRVADRATIAVVGLVAVVVVIQLGRLLIGGGA